jgi:hypothetical protein
MGDLTPVLTQWEMGDLTPVLLQWEMGDLTPVLLDPGAFDPGILVVTMSVSGFYAPRCQISQ